MTGGSVVNIAENPAITRNLWIAQERSPPALLKRSLRDSGVHLFLRHISYFHSFISSSHSRFVPVPLWPGGATLDYGPGPSVRPSSLKPVSLKDSATPAYVRRVLSFLYLSRSALYAIISRSRL